MSKPGQMGLMPEFDIERQAAPTREQEYAEYISSKEWRRLREKAIQDAGYRCQKCGASKWGAKLEVHHLTYERFKHEQMSDLIVLCETCHKGADAERKEQVQRDNARKLEAARFDGWAAKVYGDDWMDYRDPEEVSERYSEWAERKSWEE